MSLTSLLGIKPTLGGMSLPQYMNALERGELKPPVEHEGLAGFMPTPPARPAPPHADPQDASDREAMLTHIRARRVGTYHNPPPGELERQHKINRRMDAAIAALGGNDDE